MIVGRYRVGAAGRIAMCMQTVPRGVAYSTIIHE